MGRKLLYGSLVVASVAALFVTQYSRWETPSSIATADHSMHKMAAAAADSVEEIHVKELTKQLFLKVKLLKNKQKQKLQTGAVAATQEEADIIAVVKDRKEEMLALIEKDPAAFLVNALPKEVKDEMPLSAQAYIEEDLTVQGKVGVIRRDDFERNVSEMEYAVLASANGALQKYDIHFAEGHGHNLQANSTIRVDGVALAGEIVVADAAPQVAGEETGIQTIQAAPEEPKKIYKVAVIIVTSPAGPPPASAATAQSILFTAPNSIDKYYRATSRGAIGITGDVVGSYTVTLSTLPQGTVCKVFTAMQEARAAAVAAGVNLNQYDHELYVMHTSGCAASGYQTSFFNTGNGLGMKPIEIVMSPYMNVFAHELGHGLSMSHSALYISPTQYSEYGDNSDVMGSPWGKLPMLNGPHMYQMNWLSPGNLQKITQSGRYTIAYLEDPATTSPQVLRINVDNPEYMGQMDPFFISYRRPIGFDWNIDAGYIDRATVHHMTSYADYQGKEFFAGLSYLHQMLGDNQTFTDTGTGITIKQVSHSSTTAIVDITLGAAACVRQLPEFSVSPASQSGVPGEKLNYTLTVKNNDSAQCQGQKNFVLTFDAATLPNASWKVAPTSGNSGNLSTQTSTNIAISITPPVNAPDGTNILKFYVTDNQSQKVYTELNYTVFSTSTPVVPNTAPTARITPDKSSGVAPLAVSFNAGSSSDTEGPLAGFTWNFNDGSTPVSGTTTSHTFTAAGTYVVLLTATDAGGLVATTSTTITATAPLNTAPSAKISANKTNGVAPLSVTLSASGSADPEGPLAGFVWDFRDGTATAVGTSTTHSFKNPSSYAVLLTATDAGGLTATTSQLITVTANTAPVARITSNVKGGQPPLLVSFDGTTSSDAEGSIASYEWNFGDGTALGTSTTTNHTFVSVGSYTVSLKVTDQDGLSHSATTSIAVQNATFLIKVINGAGGSSSPAVDTTVVSGADQTFTILPNVNYKIADLKVDNVSQGARASFTFAKVTANHTIETLFAIATYTLAISATNGSVTKSPNATFYNHGTSVLLTAVPTTGYVFGGWTGDLSGSTSPATLVMNKNSSIGALFTPSIKSSCVDSDADGIADYNALTCSTGKDMCVGKFEAEVNKVAFKPISQKFSMNIATSALDLQSVPDFKVSKMNIGQVQFKNPVNLVSVDGTGCFKPVALDPIIQITDKKISIDTQSLPELNKPAIITFYNVDGEGFEVKRDGVVCSEPQCKILSYDKPSRTITVEVQGFSTYEIVSPGSLQRLLDFLFGWIWKI